ncbi:MAG TPA: hypothetical protein VFA84_11125 [Acidimicrobiales bacterium]|nr:hypothetical protein [Acidimicrobiales bacterium]
MTVRVLCAVVLALGLAVPVVLTASPALAAGCTATVSDPYPAQNQTVTVSFTGPANTSATVIAHYHTVDNSNTATTDANGHGSVGFNTGSAPYGETVVVNVVAGSASCSTSFLPRAPSGATTTTAASSSSSTTSTTARLTGVNSGSTTTTTGAVAVAHTAGATTAPAGSTTGSALAFTGSMSYVEAAAGVLLLALGAFFLGSARRRKELVRLLWPDER